MFPCPSIFRPVIDWQQQPQLMAKSWLFERRYNCFSRMHLCVEDELNFFLYFLSYQQYYGETLLTFAAVKGQVAIVDRLLLAGANIESKDNVIHSLLRDQLRSDHHVRALLLTSCACILFHSMDTLRLSSPLKRVIWRWFGCSWTEAPTRILW